MNLNPVPQGHPIAIADTPCMKRTDNGSVARRSSFTARNLQAGEADRTPASGLSEKLFPIPDELLIHRVFAFLPLSDIQGVRSVNSHFAHCGCVAIGTRLAKGGLKGSNDSERASNADKTFDHNKQLMTLLASEVDCSRVNTRTSNGVSQYSDVQIVPVTKPNKNFRRKVRQDIAKLEGLVSLQTRPSWQHREVHNICGKRVKLGIQLQNSLVRVKANVRNYIEELGSQKKELVELQLSQYIFDLVEKELDKRISLATAREKLGETTIFVDYLPLLRDTSPSQSYHRFVAETRKAFRPYSRDALLYDGRAAGGICLDLRDTSLAVRMPKIAFLSMQEAAFDRVSQVSKDNLNFLRNL